MSEDVHYNNKSGSTLIRISVPETEPEPALNGVASHEAVRLEFTRLQLSPYFIKMLIKMY